MSATLAFAMHGHFTFLPGPYILRRTIEETRHDPWRYRCKPSRRTACCWVSDTRSFLGQRFCRRFKLEQKAGQQTSKPEHNSAMWLASDSGRFHEVEHRDVFQPDFYTVFVLDCRLPHHLGTVIPEEAARVLLPNTRDKFEQTRRGFVWLQLGTFSSHLWMVCKSIDDIISSVIHVPVLTQPGSMTKVIRSGRSLACLYTCFMVSLITAQACVKVGLNTYQHVQRRLRHCIAHALGTEIKSKARKARSQVHKDFPT
jgi:hypothetical protein